MKKLSLNGTWALSFEDPRSQKTEHIDGQVPGDVHVDMMDAGLLEEPLYGLNMDKCRFMEEMDFIYEREIVIPGASWRRSPSWSFTVSICAPIYTSMANWSPVPTIRI